METRTPLPPERRRELINEEYHLVTMTALAILLGVCGGAALAVCFRLFPWNLIGLALIAGGAAFTRRAYYRLSAIDDEFERHGGTLEERAWGDGDDPDLFH